MQGPVGVYSRWALEMRRARFFEPGDRIGVAVSGGADSVLLLDYLGRLSRDSGFALAVVHFNHYLRGAESDTDERFVHRRALDLGLPFLRGQARVREEARKRRRNLEATARELRYRFFFSLIRRGVVGKVATAHTMDDQAETVLLHILRGTGTRGLGGIHTMLAGKILRPFLGLTRGEVEAEISARALKFRVDSTNLDIHFRRNKIRSDLLPMLEREFNPGVKRLLSELANRARDDEAYLDQQARDRAAAWRIREGRTERIPRRVLKELPVAVVRRILRQMLQFSGSTMDGITYRHIEALRHLVLDSQSGKRLVLPRGLTARTEFDWLIVSQDAEKVQPAEFKHRVVVPGSISVPEIARDFTFKIVEAGEADQGYNDSEWPCLDPARLPRSLWLRNWRRGDRYCPAGHRKPLKVKELFGSRKIPLAERLGWPIFDSERGIICARGLPAASWATAGSRDCKILLILETAL